MAIRLRKADSFIKGHYVAVCAAKSKSDPGDIYLDDNMHRALSKKFWNDFKEMGFIKEEEDAKQ